MRLLHLLAPELLHACSACFGLDGDADLVRAYTWGLVILISFTFLILAGLTYAMWRLEREKALRDDRDGRGNPASTVVRGAG